MFKSIYFKHEFPLNIAKYECIKFSEIYSYYNFTLTTYFYLFI